LILEPAYRYLVNYPVGSRIRAIYQNNINIWIEGTVTAYDENTGVLRFNQDLAKGSTAVAATDLFYVNVAGEKGTIGNTGVTATSGNTGTTASTGSTGAGYLAYTYVDNTTFELGCG
jgi:hypothetical protein